MKLTDAVIAPATLILILSGCGLEAERPSIWLENNSDQTIVLQAMTKVGPKAQITAKPRTTVRSLQSPLKGECESGWQIVDSTGKVVKAVNKICANDTVVYP